MRAWWTCRRSRRPRAAKGILYALVQGLPTDAYVLKSLEILPGGHTLTQADVGKRHAIIGDTIARDLDKKPGDTIELFAADFQIVGVYQSFSTLENGMIIVPLEDQQRLMLGRDRKVTGFSLRLKPEFDNPESIERDAQEDRRLGPIGPDPRPGAGELCELHGGDPHGQGHGLAHLGGRPDHRRRSACSTRWSCRSSSGPARSASCGRSAGGRWRRHADDPHGVGAA